MFLRRFFILGLVLAGILALCPTWAAVPAAQKPCAPYSTPITLDFKTLTPAPVYNNRLTVQGIRNLFRDHTEAVLGLHSSALGITYAETTYSAEAHSSATTVRGGYCVYLSALDLKFGWRRMQVYVASEFEPGSCEYRTVLDHENQHVAVNNGALREFAPRFRAEVEKALRTQQPVFTQNAQAGMETALASVERDMSGLMSQFQEIMAGRNAPLDSASNYGATASLCTNWNKAKSAR